MLGSTSGCRGCVRAPCFLRGRQSGTSRMAVLQGGARRRLNAVSVDTKLTLHMGITTLSLPFSVEEGKSLQAQFDALLKTFAEKQAAERPKRWEAMEYRFVDEESKGAVSRIEMFCNPNMHSTAFDAKLLITVKTEGGVIIVSEGSLGSIKSDVEVFMEQQQ
ncbi:hypothetical protein BSKO_03052 [Bryopsis sp. KO-2023]|nr:hypothetical protein BSKO_03052 [Bryopsis sp. KO-2023]